MRVIVTGSRGFLGREVVSHLRINGHEPLPVSRLDMDLRDELRTIEKFSSFGDVDAVIHLAASVGGIGANVVSPATFCYNNLLMGTSVAQAAVACSIPRVIMAGTVCSYPAVPKTIPFVEEEIWDGFPEVTNAPYGIAKRAVMELLRAYGLQYGLTSITLVPTNLYGPGDNFSESTSHVIPAMIKKFSKACRQGTPVTLWGTGNASREFLWVSEAASAFARAVSVPIPSGTAEVVNLGSGREVTMKALAEIIREAYAFDPGEVVWDSSKPDGQARRAVSSEKASRLLGWSPKFPGLEYGIKMTIQYYEGIKA